MKIVLTLIALLIALVAPAQASSAGYATFELSGVIVAKNVLTDEDSTGCDGRGIIGTVLDIRTSPEDLDLPNRVIVLCTEEPATCDCAKPIFGVGAEVVVAGEIRSYVEPGSGVRVVTFLVEQIGAAPVAPAPPPPPPECDRDECA